MSKIPLIIFLSLLSSNSLNAQDYSFKPKYFAILKSDKGKELMNQCTRCTPKDISMFWDLTQSDLENLEINFKKVLKLKSSFCSESYPNEFVSKLDEFLFQYLGVFINSKKFIYVNAFVARDTKDRWRTEPVNVCDGGYGFWGVLYDLENFEFSKLEINSAG
jgi:hypothetical protein